MIFNSDTVKKRCIQTVSYERLVNCSFELTNGIFIQLNRERRCFIQAFLFNLNTCSYKFTLSYLSYTSSAFIFSEIRKGLGQFEDKRSEQHANPQETGYQDDAGKNVIHTLILIRFIKKDTPEKQQTALAFLFCQKDH
jgi:hypothetical protein